MWMSPFATSGRLARSASAPSSVPEACPPSSGTHAASMKAARGSSLFLALITPLPKTTVLNHESATNLHSVIVSEARLGALGGDDFVEALDDSQQLFG